MKNQKYKVADLFGKNLRSFDSFNNTSSVKEIGSIKLKSLAEIQFKDNQEVVFETFNIDQFLDLLVEGKTVVVNNGSDFTSSITYTIEEKKHPEQEANRPVSIHYDAEGNPDGVRVKTLDEDFIIVLEDAEEGREMNWATAMEKYGNVLPNRKQASIICAYLDDIKKAMKEAGGDDLDGWYWTCAEYDAYSAWFYSGDSGGLGYTDKYYMLSVRPVLA